MSDSTPSGEVESNATGRDKNPVAERGVDSTPTTEDEDPAPTTEDAEPAPTTEDADPTPTTTAEAEPRLPVPASDHQSPSGDVSSPHPATLTHDDQDTGFVDGRISPSPGDFTITGASKFLTPSAIDYFKAVPGGQHWTEMVRTYLQLEQLPVMKGVRSFPTFFYDLVLIVLT